MGTLVVTLSAEDFAEERIRRAADRARLDRVLNSAPGLYGTMARIRQQTGRRCATGHTQWTQCAACEPLPAA